MLFTEQNLPAIVQSPHLSQRAIKSWSDCVNSKFWPRAWYLRALKHGDHRGTDRESSALCCLPLSQLLYPTLGMQWSGSGVWALSEYVRLCCCHCSCCFACAWSMGQQKGFTGWNKIDYWRCRRCFYQNTEHIFTAFLSCFLECEVVLNVLLTFSCFLQTGNPALTQKPPKILVRCLFWSNCCSLTHTAFFLAPDPYVCPCFLLAQRLSS